jgi:hypothetical protein
MFSAHIGSHMKHSVWIALCAAVLMPAFAHAAGNYAYDKTRERQDHRDDRRDDRRDDHRNDRRDSRGYYYDNRFGHNHYYPPRGYAVGVLPRGYVTYRYRNTPYYYNSGIWYRPGPGGFVVVRPAIGLYIGALPPFYTTVWYGGVPYYYADDVYYRYRQDRREYEVVDAPPETQTSTTQPAGAQSDLFIYPKNGQGEEQQSKDRYECHSWAANQSGFDPTQPMGGVDESQASAKRADYQRAQTACLEARGYSVK